MTSVSIGVSCLREIQDGISDYRPTCVTHTWTENRIEAQVMLYLPVKGKEDITFPCPVCGDHLAVTLKSLRHYRRDSIISWILLIIVLLAIAINWPYLNRSYELGWAGLLVVESCLAAIIFLCARALIRVIRKQTKWWPVEDCLHRYDYGSKQKHFLFDPENPPHRLFA